MHLVTAATSAWNTTELLLPQTWATWTTSPNSYFRRYLFVHCIMLPLYQCPSITKPIWAIRVPGYPFCHAYEFTLRPFISVRKFETVRYVKVELRHQPIKCQDIYSQGVTYLTADGVWCDGVSIVLNGIRTHCIQCDIRCLKAILSLFSKGHINFVFHQNVVKQLADITVYSWLVFFQ